MAQKEEIIYNNEDSQDDFSLEAKLKKLRRKLKKRRAEKEEYLSLAQRARADLINYRKRQEEITAEFKKYHQAELIKELLPVLDSLESALTDGGQTSRNIKPIKEQLETILKNYGLREIKTSGEKFDPNLHEAVDVVESDKKEGIIAEEIQKGYMLYDKALRVSKVRVAK